MKKTNSSDVYGFLIAAAIIGFLIWSMYFSKNNHQTQSTTTPIVYQPPAQPYQANNNPTTNPPTRSVGTSSQSTYSTDTTNHRAVENNYQLCQVRLINTMNGTDKTGGYRAVMDVETKTLTLSYVNNATEIIQIKSEGGGLNRLRFYNNSSLEAEKTVFRRTDLENGDKEIIYTTRTEQVKIIISY